MATQSGLHICMDAKAASGVGLVFYAGDYDNVEILLDTIAATDGVIKFQTSDSDTPPDFTATQSPSNSWYYAQVVDEMENSEIDGTTGITPAGVKHYKLRLNSNGARWINAIIASQTAGAYTVKMRGYKMP